MNQPISKEFFDALSPRGKGYAVYMCGCRDDQPNIPSEFTPKPSDKDEYEGGIMEGILEMQDGSE